MINRYIAVVESCDRTETQAWLKLKGGRLAARLWPGIKAGQQVAIRIRPEDVMLSAGHPGRISARNILPGHVRSVKVVPEGAYVTLNVGFPLTSLVTRGALANLRIGRGSALFGIVKATAIIPEADVPRRFKVILVGRKGDIHPREIEFMRAIDHTGSIAGASRELRITYRTAWLWVRAINRAWGAPLVARVHGGPGGGGTSLTREGRAALALVASLEQPKASPADSGRLLKNAMPRQLPRKPAPSPPARGARGERAGVRGGGGVLQQPAKASRSGGRKSLT